MVDGPVPEVIVLHHVMKPEGNRVTIIVEDFTLVASKNVTTVVNQMHM
jgi:hypothetical protein